MCVGGNGFNIELRLLNVNNLDFKKKSHCFSQIFSALVSCLLKKGPLPRNAPMDFSLAGIFHFILVHGARQVVALCVGGKEGASLNSCLSRKYIEECNPASGLHRTAVR